MSATIPTADSRSMRAILFSSFIGSAVEFYDFLLYSLAASVVFQQLFFSNLSPVVGTIMALGTLAVGYVARPLGGVIFGHFGDKVGRKSMLVVTMSMMGTASFLIGVLPTRDSIGAAAPLLLILIRVVQGLAVGGEWGGAALMALEHAGMKRRGVAASVANVGGPAGMVLASFAFAAASAMPEDAFLSWGWRLPFLASAVLVLVGLFVRLKISESPIFIEAQRQADQRPAEERVRPPLFDVLSKQWRAVILAAGGGLMTLALQGVLASFVLAYAVAAGHSRSSVLMATGVSALLQALTIPLFAALSDRLGRRPVMLGGIVATVIMIQPILTMIGQGSTALLYVGMLVGCALLQSSMYGPLSAFISEMFNTRSRYTGASLGYQLATLVGGGFTPAIAASLLALRGDNDPLYVSLFLIVVAVPTALAIWLAPESSRRQLLNEGDTPVVEELAPTNQPSVAG